jgi:hypothetical protein
MKKFIKIYILLIIKLANAYIKDPSQVSSQKKDYLMFINKNTAQKFANMSVYHEVVIPGWMPLVVSKASASVETDPLTAARESVKKVNMK